MFGVCNWFDVDEVDVVVVIELDVVCIDDGGDVVFVLGFELIW